MEPVSRKYIPKKLLFDSRMLDRNLRDGIISLKEYEQHIANLPEAGENAAVMETQFSSLMGPESIETEPEGE